MRCFAVVLVFVVAACRRDVLLDVRVQGASAVQRVAAGERYWFDEPDAPTLVTPAEISALRLEWAGGAAATVVRSTRADGQSRLVLARPGDGERVLVVRAPGAVRTLHFVFREPARAIVDSFAAQAHTDAVAARVALDTLEPHEWSWGCAGLAKATAVEHRAEAYAACADGALARGFVTEAVGRRIAALYWALQLRQHARAQAYIAQLKQALVDFPDARLASLFHYQLGDSLAKAGAFREAEAVLRQAIAEALEVQLVDAAVEYRALLATVLSESGRHREALVEAALLPRVGPFAMRANVAWVQLLARAAGVPGVDVTTLRASLDVLSEEAAKDGRPFDAANQLSNLAWLELVEGRPLAVREAVTRARAHLAGKATVVAVFLDWVEGRQALAAGDGAAAVRSFEAMLSADALEAERAPDSTWRAQLGLAEARLLLRQPAEAARALAQARRSLSLQARFFEEPGERVVFLQDRRHAIAEAVTAFARAGKCELAWRLADDAQAWLARSFEADRRVRLAQLMPEARATFEAAERRWSSAREALLSEQAPSLAAVQELEAWKAERLRRHAQLREEATALAATLDAQAPLAERAAFEPKQLAADEALLELFTSSGSSWAFFVRRDGAVTCGDDPAKLVTRDVRHLAIVDGGVVLAPSLLLELLTTATIGFVPSAAWLSSPRAQTRGAPLFVGDPRRDLPGARKEARALAKQLGGELLEGDAATLEALTSRWAARPVLHFAGHGRLSASTPWDARLELAKGQTLDFDVLLARRPAPGLVVLSGCETGKVVDAPADGIGLAEGFLAGGSNHVLATTLEVNDDGARTFIERFYRLGGVSDPTAAFRLAALEAQRAGDERWQEWKLLGRR